jgi:hypothetical protein
MRLLVRTLLAKSPPVAPSNLPVIPPLVELLSEKQRSNRVSQGASVWEKDLLPSAMIVSKIQKRDSESALATLEILQGTDAEPIEASIPMRAERKARLLSRRLVHVAREAQILPRIGENPATATGQVLSLTLQLRECVQAIGAVGQVVPEQAEQLGWLTPITIQPGWMTTQSLCPSTTAHPLANLVVAEERTKSTTLCAVPMTWLVP